MVPFYGANVLLRFFTPSWFTLVSYAAVLLCRHVTWGAALRDDTIKQLRRRLGRVTTMESGLLVDLNMMVTLNSSLLIFALVCRLIIAGCTRILSVESWSI